MNHNILNKIAENYIQNRVREDRSTLYIGYHGWERSACVIRGKNIEDACRKLFDKIEAEYYLTDHIFKIFNDHELAIKYRNKYAMSHLFTQNEIEDEDKEVFDKLIYEYMTSNDNESYIKVHEFPSIIK